MVLSTSTLKCLCQALVQQSQTTSWHTPKWHKSAKGETWNVDMHLYTFTSTSLHMVHRLCLSMASTFIRVSSHMVVFVHELVQNPLFISYTRKQNLSCCWGTLFQVTASRLLTEAFKKLQNTKGPLKQTIFVDCIRSFIYDKDFWIYEVWNIYFSSEIFLFVSTVNTDMVFQNANLTCLETMPRMLPPLWQLHF